MQLDKKERGFSFSKEGPLNMRMDGGSGITAEEIVNRSSEKELAALFWNYGEERRSRPMAKAIVEERKKSPFRTTSQLSHFLASQFSRGKKKLHPATLVFQALRIAVNGELDAIERGIKKALDFLAPNGRMGVISFHSLEDRIVKNLFREAAKSCKREKLPAAFRLLHKKAIQPSETEVKHNKRARSGKLRFIEKVAQK